MSSDESIRTDQTSLIVAFTNNPDEKMYRRGFLLYCLQLAMGFRKIYKEVCKKELGGFEKDSLASKTKYALNDLTVQEIKDVANGKLIDEASELLDALNAPSGTHQDTIDELRAELTERENLIAELRDLNAKATDAAIKSLKETSEREKLEAENKARELQEALTGLTASSTATIEALKSRCAELEAKSDISERLDRIETLLALFFEDVPPSAPPGAGPQNQSVGQAKLCDDLANSFQSMDGKLIGLDFKNPVAIGVVRDWIDISSIPASCPRVLSDKIKLFYGQMLDHAILVNALSDVRSFLLSAALDFTELRNKMESAESCIKDQKIKARWSEFIPSFLGASTVDILEKNIKNIENNLSEYTRGKSYRLGVTAVDDSSDESNSCIIKMKEVDPTSGSQISYIGELINYLINQCILLKSHICTSHLWLNQCKTLEHFEIFKWSSSEIVNCLFHDHLSRQVKANGDLLNASLKALILIFITKFAVDDTWKSRVSIHQFLMALQIFSVDIKKWICDVMSVSDSNLSRDVIYDMFKLVVRKYVGANTTITKDNRDIMCDIGLDLFVDSIQEE